MQNGLKQTLSQPQPQGSYIVAVVAKFIVEICSALTIRHGNTGSTGNAAEVRIRGALIVLISTKYGLGFPFDLEEIGTVSYLVGRHGDRHSQLEMTSDAASLQGQ